MFKILVQWIVSLVTGGGESYRNNMNCKKGAHFSRKIVSCKIKIITITKFVFFLLACSSTLLIDTSCHILQLDSALNWLQLLHKPLYLFIKPHVLICPPKRRITSHFTTQLRSKLSTRGVGRDQKSHFTGEGCATLWGNLPRVRGELGGAVRLDFVTLCPVGRFS